MSGLSALGEAALKYARAGILVFPCRPRGKEPMTEHGFKDATTDETQIREWWTKWPDANIGVLCKENGIIALDVDPRHGGRESIAKMLAEGLEIPADTPRVRTGSGGSHTFFLAPEEPGTWDVGGLRPGIDIKYDGYVVAPPSVHESGRRYEAIVPLTREALRPLPEMLREAILTKTRGGKAPAVVGPEGDALLEGQRNNELTRIAGKLRRDGAGEAAILVQLQETNAARCRPPLPDGEVEAIARSVGRYEPAPEPVSEVAIGSLEEAISILKSVLEHPDPFFHASLILGAAQDHIIDLLHSVFYLVFGGGPDTGKGTANAAAMALTRDGIVLGGASGPYLRDTLGDGRAIAISETETLLKENPQLLAIIRNGNRRTTARVGLKIPAGKGWMNATVDTFGFKTMDFHDRLDAHVLGRALQFEMVRSKNLDIAMDAEYLRECLAPVRAWLAGRAEIARAGRWTAERVREVWYSKEFRGRVKAFRNAWGRHGIIAAYLLLVNDVFELDLETTIRELMDAREPEVSEAAQEVQEAIEELVSNDLKPTTELRVQDDILARVNVLRAGRGLRPRSSVSGALRELGFSTKAGNRISANKNMSGPNRKKAVVLPYEFIRSSQPAGLGTTQSVEPGEALPAVHDVLRELCADGHNAVLEDVLRVAAERGIASERTESILKRMRSEGDLFEPSAGTYRLREALGP